MAQRIRNKIVAVATDPSAQSHDVVPLTGRPGFRLRVGDWRVIFDMDEATLDVLAIERRGEAYKPLRRR